MARGTLKPDSGDIYIFEKEIQFVGKQMFIFTLSDLYHPRQV